MKKYDKFQWLEFCPDLEGKRDMITIDELPNKREQYGINKPMFISRFLFNKAAPVGPVLSNFYMDFDWEEDPQLALAELVDAAEHFVTLGVDETLLKLRYTGGKGGSIEVPFGYFDAAPAEELPQVWRRIAEDLKNSTHWKTVDLSVYDKRRVWRMTNTRHKSGRFKIPVTIDQLHTLKLGGIQELAKDPQDYTPVDDRTVEVTPAPRLRAAFKDALTEVRREKTKFKKLVGEKAAEFDKIFPCVEAVITEGVDAEEFQRNPTAFNIAVALIDLAAPDDYILDRLTEFAKNCTPPLPEERYDELPHCIEMAKTHEYVTHCGTPVFEAHCIGKTKCWVFQKKTSEDEEDEETEDEVGKIEEFSADEVAQAEAFLNDPMNINLVESALSDIVKEEGLTMSLFILVISCQSVQVGGESSTGKSHITDVVLDCFPKIWIEELTGVSDRTVRYLGKEVKILYIKEMKGTKVGSDEESSAEFDIKQGISEGKLNIRVTIKNPKTGKFKTQLVKTKFGSFISTTTDVGITPELQNRMWEVVTKDSISRDVSKHIIMQMGLPKSQQLNKSSERKVIRCAMAILDKEAPQEFIIPYSENLIEIINTFGNQPRIRRDAQKLIKIIEGFAKLNYRNRPIYDDNGLKHTICLPIDLYWAIKYLWPAILGTFSGSTKRSDEVWETIEKIIDAGKRLDSATLAGQLDITQRKSLDWLKRFANEGKLTEGARDPRGISYSALRTLEHGGEKSRVKTIPYLLIRSNFNRGVKGLNAASITQAQFLDDKSLPQTYLDFEIIIPCVPGSERPNVEDLPDAPVQVVGRIDSGMMTMEQLLDSNEDSMTYGGVSTEICWTIIKGRRFYRCPKCHHRLHLSLVDDDLHCHNCGHVEHVEHCDPEELE